MNTFAKHSAALTLLTLGILCLPGCATSGGAAAEIEPPVIEPVQPLPAAPPAAVAEEGSTQEEGEVPLAVAASANTETATPKDADFHVPKRRHEAIHDFVTDAQMQLLDV